MLSRQRKCSCIRGQIFPTRINNNYRKLRVSTYQCEINLWSTHVNNVRLAEPIRRPIRWRAGFSKSHGSSASVSFLPLPLLSLSFFGPRSIFRAAKTENLNPIWDKQRRWSLFFWLLFYMLPLHTSFCLLYSSINHILFLYLYYFKYCNRLFYSHLASLAPDED